MARRKRTGTRSAQPEMVHPEAAGIDIGARELYVSVRADRDPEPIRSFSTWTRKLHDLAQWLQTCRVQSVAMESTGVYWIPVYQILESYGFDVVLVNARHVRAVPGRKSDVADCEWLRYLHSVGLLRGSFRPANEICRVRTLLRHRDTLVKTAAQATLHMQKAMDQMNIRLHHVVTDITGLSGLRIIDAIIAGERDPAQLADLAHPRIRTRKRDLLIGALEGTWSDELLLTLRQARETHAHFQRLLAECDRAIAALIRSFPCPSASVDATDPEVPLRVQLKQLMGTDLMRIPGIGEQTVLVLFTEVGPELSRFPTSAHFASWLGLCPKNKISGGKLISSRTGPGANRAAQALRWATQALYRSQSPLGHYFRRLRARVGTPAAVVATAHKLARIIYRLITDRVDYEEDKITESQYHDRQRFLRRVRNQARLLGYKLVPEEA